MTAEIIDFKHRARIRPPVASRATTVAADRPDAPHGWPLLAPLPFSRLPGDDVMEAIARATRPLDEIRASIDRVMAPHRAMMAAVNRAIPTILQHRNMQTWTG
jgi:hypothetical protein